MDDLYSDISKWFTKQPKWLQKAAKRLLEQGKLVDADIDEFASICLNEARGVYMEKTPLPDNLIKQKTDRIIRLYSFGNVKGVDALAPGKELEFDGKDLVIVYGMNGSGKSGYTRILKQICKVKGVKELKENIFKDKTGIQTATVKFKEEGSKQELVGEWNGQDVINELADIEIFDTLSGQTFVNKKGETCYEPAELSWLTKLADFCTKVKDKLKSQSEFSHIDLQVPQKLGTTKNAEWLSKTSHATTNGEIEEKCSFTEDNKKRLTDLEKILEPKSSADRLIILEKKKKSLEGIVQKADEVLASLSNEKCNEIINNKISIEQQEVIVKNIANKKFGESYLNGTGSETWKNMWAAAKEYFEKEAYLGGGYSNMSEAESCALCQQPLMAEAKSRFEEFEFFMNQKAEENLRAMKKEYEDKLAQIKNVDSKENLKNFLNLSELEESHPIIDFFDELRSRKEKLPALNSLDSLMPLTKQDSLSNIRDILKQCENDIKICNENGDTADREKATNDHNELLAKEWLAENKQGIIGKVNIEKERELYRKAIEKANTKQLTSKKISLAPQLITEPFAERFNNELSKLGADDIKVKLVPTGGQEGHNYHEILLHKDGVGLKDLKLADVLSEGENRIVSLAAFLADVTGKESHNPFFFDDPISSLDEFYEEEVVKRLLELSKKRQVIIFTHRLSLVGNVEQLINKEEVKHCIINIINSESETGIPAPIHIQNSSIGEFLADMTNPNEKKKLEELDNAHEFEKLYKDKLSICVNFRMILEKSIEEDLFCKVIKRPSIKVRSDLIKNIKGITREDIETIDKLMTKYSRYVHSHHNHYKLPKIKELFDDIENFKQWREEFKKRKN